VDRHVAIPETPLGRRIRKYETILAGGKHFDFVAAFTLLNSWMAGAAIKLAAFLGHKETIQTLFYACTNHFDHILSFGN
jgi:hypothetical protein